MICRREAGGCGAEFCMRCQADHTEKRSGVKAKVKQKVSLMCTLYPGLDPPRQRGGRRAALSPLSLPSQAPRATRHRARLQKYSGGGRLFALEGWFDLAGAVLGLTRLLGAL